MYTMTELLMNFWVWAGISEQEYAMTSDSSQAIEPFYYPYFDELRNECKQLINKQLTPQQLDDFLTCLALDSEEEIILQWCKEFADDIFLDGIVRTGCQHLQPEARWQIAELLRCRDLPNGNEYIDYLCSDTNAYVKKRAQNTKRDKEAGQRDKGTKGQGDGSVVPSESE